MKQSTRKIIDYLLERYPVLSENESSLICALELMIASYRNGGKMLVCGNGGSAADALHIVGELMKAFVLPRKIEGEEKELLLSQCEHGALLSSSLQGALPTIALVSEVGLVTAYANDVAPELAFAQQVYGYGKKGDVLLSISTSGNSQNVLYANEVARAKQMKVVGLTGNGGGKMAQQCDACICVPMEETYRIQELHLPVYHVICLALENEFFGKEED